MKSTGQQIKFRFTNRLLYYSLCLVVIFFGIFFAIYFVVNLLGKNHSTIIFLLILFAFLIVIICLIYCFSKFLLKVTNKWGTAVFHEDSIDIYLGKKQITLAYTDIKNLEYGGLYGGRYHGVKQPIRYVLKIVTRQKNYTIRASIVEESEIFEKGIKPTLYYLQRELRNRINKCKFR